MNADVILSLKNISIKFGGLTAVSQLSLDVQRGSIVGLIGPNGAGKTTCFNIITGVYRPTAGEVYFAGKNITGKRPDIVNNCGIARTFQNIRLFHTMSVLENVLIAKHSRFTANCVEALLGLPRYKREAKQHREECLELLEQMQLADVAHEAAVSLPYGKQRRLEIARALASNPGLLLLDEPAAGMNPQESLELMEFMKVIRERYKLTILMIEHHMEVVMGACSHILVLDYGVPIAEGTPTEIACNHKVIEAYLGVVEDHA